MQCGALDLLDVQMFKSVRQQACARNILRTDRLERVAYLGCPAVARRGLLRSRGGNRVAVIAVGLDSGPARRMRLRLGGS